MMPHTVPNRPTNGATAPMLARTPMPRRCTRAVSSSIRSRREATRSLMPSRPSRSCDRCSSVRAASSITRAVPCCTQASACSLGRLAACSNSARAARSCRACRPSSQPLASSTVQVASDAKASAIITAFTTTSAARYMPHGVSAGAATGARSAGSIISGSIRIRGHGTAASRARIMSVVHFHQRRGFHTWCWSTEHIAGADREAQAHAQQQTP